MLESINFQEILHTYLIPWSINIGLAIIIFIIGYIVSGSLVSIVRKVLSNARVDSILVNFVCSIIGWILILIISIMALNRLGVNTTSLIALIGAAGLAISLSLQDSIKNFAAGVMLITFRPFKEGDYVEAGGTSGSVQNIEIFSTTFNTPDNRHDDDIKKAKEIIEKIISSDSRILNIPEPLVAVGELADSSVNLVVRPWVNTGDYWPVLFDITEKIKLEFDANGISIPIPQMDVHMDREEVRAEAQ